MKDRKKQELRILQILPALEMGGVERGAIDVAVFLKKKGYFSVIASRGGRLVSHLRKNGIIHEYLPLHSKNPFVIWMNIYRLVKIIKNHKIQIVHARSRAPAWSAYFAAKKIGIPFITTFHGVYSFRSRVKKFYNSIMARGTVVIAVSKFVASSIQKTYPMISQKIVTVLRGVDLDVFDPKTVTDVRMEAVMSHMQLPDDAFIILLPGRISRVKGHEVLLEALSRLNRQDFICLFVGSTEKKGFVQELEAQAQNYGLRNRLFIVDECRDMPALYRLATVVVSPSTQPESFGRIIAEAGAMGCVGIASHHGGAKEIIVDGKTGFFFPTEDSRALSYLIEKILDMSIAERTQLKEAAIAHIRKNFDCEIMLSKTLKIYEETLG